MAAAGALGGLSNPAQDFREVVGKIGHTVDFRTPLRVATRSRIVQCMMSLNGGLDSNAG